MEESRAVSLRRGAFWEHVPALSLIFNDAGTDERHSARPCPCAVSVSLSLDIRRRVGMATGWQESRGQPEGGSVRGKLNMPSLAELIFSRASFHSMPKTTAKWTPLPLTLPFRSQLLKNLIPLSLSHKPSPFQVFFFLYFPCLWSAELPVM